MNQEDSLYRLYQKAKRVVLQSKEEDKLPSGAFFLGHDSIVVTQNKNGDMRYPYSFDGRTLWAYASGYLTLNESSFYIFPQTLEGKESYLAFFGGMKNKYHYDYFSITGVNDTIFGLDVSKLTVFTPTYAVYFREYKRILFYVKVSLSLDKVFIYDIGVMNLSSKNKEVYLSNYLNPLLLHSNFESEEAKWFKTSKLVSCGALITTKEDLSRSVHLFNYSLIQTNLKDKHIKTTSRMNYVGDKNASINSSINLRNGEIQEKDTTSFIDQSIYGDLIKLNLNPKERKKYSYCLKYSKNEFSEIPVYEGNEKSFEELESNYKKASKTKNIQIKFNEFSPAKVDSSLFNKFVHSVINQVDYCAKSKNSSQSLLGVRDAAQMIEAFLIWDPKTARKKIIHILNYIDVSGRPPRQFSEPQSDGLFLTDNREFIDQGQWLISLVHKYLCYTQDKSILKEQCGYIELLGRNQARLTKEKDNVFKHLERIMNYLISNIDEESGCLKALYGDWNDAVDGLGTTDKEDERFGNGVSTMASLHLYRNLKEMAEICGVFGVEGDKYLKIRELLGKAILKNLVVSNKQGEKRIVHGFGENKSFYVGSFDDADHQSRNSATSNAFYVVSELYKKDESLVKNVLKAFEDLDSPYGIRTFDKYFDLSNASCVGRIVNLPKGTAENAATYIHGAMFCVKALAMLNETEKAFDQIFKLIPITHKQISVSSFVMPNSYGYNKELEIDGQSMNDWYTGSSNTFIKVLVDDIFGIHPGIAGQITIKPISNIPVKHASIRMHIQNKVIELDYSNLNKHERLINNEKVKEVTFDLNKINEKLIYVKVEE